MDFSSSLIIVSLIGDVSFVTSFRLEGAAAFTIVVRYMCQRMYTETTNGVSMAIDLVAIRILTLLLYRTICFKQRFSH